MEEKITVDRIEGDILVCICADGTILEIKKEDAPPDIIEGDICISHRTADGRILLCKNEIETENKKAEMKSRLSSLFAKNK